jgi:non-homologous end joining protein Ku
MPEKISFAEMRAAGMRRIVVCCSNERCGRWIRLNIDRWAENTARGYEIGKGQYLLVEDERGVRGRST